MATSSVKYLAKWAVAWFILSGLVTSWHVCFVFLRPRSLPGGDLDHFFPGYHLFLSAGRPYHELHDPLIWALAWCNIGEVIFGFVSAVLILAGKPSASVLGLVAVTMSFWKTVLCCVLPSPLCSSPSLFSNIDWRDLLLYYAISISPWILVTGILMVCFVLELSGLIAKLSKIEAKGKMPRTKGD